MYIQRKVQPENSSWWKVLLAFTTIAMLGYLFVRTGQYLKKVGSEPRVDERMTVLRDLTINGVNFYDGEFVYFTSIKPLGIHGSQPGEIKWCVVSPDRERAECMDSGYLDRGIKW